MKVKKKSDKILSWGIVMYLPGGGYPKDDKASFDGWYREKADAVAIYNSWCKLHPQWIVALVKQDQSRFPDKE